VARPDSSGLSGQWNNKKGFGMRGAIFFSGTYGSTAEYAAWISEATGLPAFDVNDAGADPSKYDFLVLGSSVIIYKLTIRKWVKDNRTAIDQKPIVLFTVSGASAGPKLDGWIADSLPEGLISRMEHVALRGRLDPKKLNWWVRLTLRIGAWIAEDDKVKKEELEGFDHMDKSGIEPIIRLVRQFQSGEATPCQ